MSIYNVDGIETNIAYNIDGEELSSAYEVDGTEIPFVSPLPLDYSNYSTTDLYTYVANGFNGFDVHEGVIAQLMANNKLYLFNLDDGSAITTAMAITCSHGDSATFGKDYYASGDEFPLLYCTADTTPAVIYINRITRGSATLIKTLKFSSVAGYYGAGAYDFKNGICYVVAYSENSYTSDNGGSNKTLVTVWDLKTLNDNGDGTYMPAFIRQFQCPFIYVMQGLQFFDGYIWISSGYNNGGAQHVYAMNPSDGVIEHTITLDDTIEVEGLAWVYDENTNKFWMLVGQQNGAKGINYSRIDFATAT